MKTNDLYSTERFTKTVSVEEYLKNYVFVDKFLEYCKVCPNYNHMWSCPPYDFDPIDYWKKFKWLDIVSYKISFDEQADKDERQEILYKVKSEMLKELLSMEDEIPNSIALSAGSCNTCGRGNCARLLGKPCRFPKSMRFSIEAIGGDVVKTAENFFGIKIEWVKGNELLPFAVLMGGLLYK